MIISAVCSSSEKVTLENLARNKKPKFRSFRQMCSCRHRDNSGVFDSNEVCSTNLGEITSGDVYVSFPNLAAMLRTEERKKRS